ncbi:hypothetical protein ACFOZY_04445 [Chungangia koreensis]|uniref:Lipoprotein n=1 Tax=Chungangia koreensis TaxID=752657 RepID=A0ABV8X307_9LACT
MKYGKVCFWIILLSIVLSACGQKNLIFSGENENWSVHYEFIQVGESVESTGYIKYIGPEPTPDRIDYQLDIDTMSGNGPLAGNGIMYLLKSSCLRNCSLPSGDSEFEAIVKWDEETERITLKLE